MSCRRALLRDPFVDDLGFEFQWGALSGPRLPCLRVQFVSLNPEDANALRGIARALTDPVDIKDGQAARLPEWASGRNSDAETQRWFAIASNSETVNEICPESRRPSVVRGIPVASQTLRIEEPSRWIANLTDAAIWAVCVSMRQTLVAIWIHVKPQMQLM